MPAHIIFYYALVLISCAAALKWGSWPEWGVALVMALGVILTSLVRSKPATAYQSIEWLVFLVDCVTLVSFVTIALIADRWWPLWTAAFQIIATGAHAAKYVNPDLLRAGYSAMVASSAYPHLLFLAIGTLNAAARARNWTAPLSWAGFCAVMLAVRSRRAS